MTPATHPLHRSRALALALTLALLAVVGYLDYATGPQMTFTLLYLLPISISAWFVGRRTGIIFCICAAVIGAVVELAAHETTLAISLWNGGVRFGVYFAFCWLLAHLDRKSVV